MNPKQFLMNIPDNLTREEFEQLANRQPRFDGDFVYRLTQMFVDSNTLKNPYPKFELDYDVVRLFNSFEEAVSFIKTNQNEDIYCSWITQVPVGAREYERTAEWFYDKDGNLLDWSCQKTHGDHDDIDFCFFGRPADRQRFKEGDIVEVISGKEVSLAVLCGNVTDVNWCWDYYQRIKANRDLPYYGLDYTDESTCVIDGPSYTYHSHPSPLCLMKPRFPIPPDIEAEMRTWKERADKETVEEMENYPSRKNRSKTVNSQDYVSDFYNLDIYFKFDEDNEPLLLLSDDYGLKVSLHTCRPEYADYKDFTDRLTPSQLNALQDYLEDIDVGKTKWWYMLRDWNEDEDTPRIPINTQLPDYTFLIKDDR